MNGPTEVRVFAPATVGNVICGFDVFGLALEAPGDEVVARRTDAPGVSLLSIQGDGGRLPTDPGRNAATAAAAAVLQRSGLEGGLEMEVYKGLPIASGMGGSAASSVAGAVAAAAVLQGEMALPDLLVCALEGERAAVGSGHADNAAPALHGGIVLVRPGPRPDVVPLPVPDGTAVALVHPPLETETGASRRALEDRIPLQTAVSQWANTAAFVAGLYQEDWDLVSRSLVDHVAEPIRSASVPGFAAARDAAVESGAVGAGLSGSGPSLFALCRSLDDARAAGRAMVEAFARKGMSGVVSHVSPVGRRGARVVGHAGRSS